MIHRWDHNKSCHSFCPVGWGCRTHRLLLCRGVRPPPHECPEYDTKQSDGEVPAVLELWRMRSTPSVPSLLGPLWPEVVAPDKGPIYGSNRTNGILMLNWIVWLNWIAWNRNVLTIKPYLNLNCVLMLNWIIWNRTVFDIKTVFTLNWIVTYNCLTSLKWKCFWQLNCTYAKLNCLK